MNLDKFSKIAESLRAYRRAELKDFESEIGSKPVEALYVDPLPGEAVLKSVLSSNTTFILGRKGTGKSTVFAKAQSVLREQKKVISAYIDVKSIYDVLNEVGIPDIELEKLGISVVTYRSHMLRKIMLGKVISDLLEETSKSCDKLTLLDRWSGKKKQYEDLKSSLADLGDRVKMLNLNPMKFQFFKNHKSIKNRAQSEKSHTNSQAIGLNASVSLEKASVGGNFENSLSDFDRTLDDKDTYQEYSDVVLRSFPFNEILDEIQTLLSESGMLRLVAFFDDFSELNFTDQRLFVDVILSPLNNSSNENVKLKIAAYPGRVYYGKIDPSKVDTIGLDFSDLYESNEVQEMERSALDYTKRLLSHRFTAFGENIEDYLELNTNNLDDIIKMMFRASFNVPRIMGHLLHILFLDRISKDQKLT